MKSEEKEEILYLEDMYMLRSMTHTCVTVRIERWHHYIPRVKLTMIEGFYKTSEEIDNALKEARSGKKPPILPEDYPKHFELICRPQGFLTLAKILTKICKPKE